VDYVTCWHAAAGYWGGSEASEERLKSSPTPHLRAVEPAIAWDPASLIGSRTPTTPKAVHALYDKLYAMLRSCGVDAVKADAQSGVGALGHSRGGGAWASRMFVSAMERAAATHFGTAKQGDSVAVLNCMCHSTEQLYSYASSAVVRASDDFYPRDSASWRFHITACAYNSVFLSTIGLPDYDMFQSVHPAAWQHAAARAVSGGPMTLSDAPGKHDTAVLDAIALADGSTFVALAPARVCADCLFTDVSRDGHTVMKLAAPNGAGGAVVGLFNVQDSYWCRESRRFRFRDEQGEEAKGAGLKASVKIADALPAWRHQLLNDNLEAQQSARLGSDVVARSFRTGKTTRLALADSIESIELLPGDFEIYSLSRLRTAGTVDWAPLGLVGMLNGGGAVLDAFSTDAARGTATVRAKGSGRTSSGRTFGVFATQRPSAVTIDGVATAFEYADNVVLVDLPGTAVALFKIDLAFRDDAVR